MVKRNQNPPNMPAPDPRELILLTPEAAAKLLGVSIDTLSDWRCRGGQGPRYLRVGRLIRYRECELQEWLSTRVCQNTGTYPRHQR